MPPLSATQNAKVRLAPKITADDPPPVQPFPEQAKPSPVVHHADSADLSEKWSVQVSAAPAKDIASLRQMSFRATVIFRSDILADEQFRKRRVIEIFGGFKNR